MSLDNAPLMSDPHIQLLGGAPAPSPPMVAGKEEQEKSIKRKEIDNRVSSP